MGINVAVKYTINKALAVALFAWLLPIADAATGFDGQTATLQPSASDGFRLPGESLRIALGSDLAVEQPAALSLELDAIDISALVQRDNSQLTYTPVQPLSPGKHELRLMRYGDDGSVAELGFWSFDVRQSGYFQEAVVEGQFDLGVSQRVAENDSFQGSDFGVQGGGQVHSVLAGDNWRIESSADLMVVKDRNLSFSDRRLDMPGFSITATAGRYTLKAGDQVLGSSSLLQDGYQQRGISTTALLPLIESSLSVFRVSASQVVGVDSGFGVSDPDNRITGAKWDYRPVRNDTVEIYVASTLLSGRASEPDYGSFTQELNSTVHEGDAWNLIVDSQFFQRQLRLRMEKAETRYDFDGDNTGFDPVEDDAWSGLLLLNPEPTDHDPTEDAVPIDWSLGVEAKQIGTFYKSLSNIYLPADKNMRRLFANAMRGKWRWDGSYAIEDNNLDENPNYATTEIRQWMMDVGYSNYERPTAGSLLALLGQPSYTLSINGTSLKDVFTPDGYLVNDMETRYSSVNAIFSHDTWDWSLGYNQSRLEDNTGWQPDALTRALQLRSGIQLGDYYYVNLGWQTQRTRYREQAITTSRHLYSVDARGELIPGRLSVNFSMGLNQNHAQEDPFNAQWEKTTYISSSLNWRIREPDTHRAGLDLSLTFARNDHRDQLYTAYDINNINGNQVFIGLRTSLPVAFSGGL